MIKVTESRPQTGKNSVFSLLYLEVQKTRFHIAESWIVVGKKIKNTGGNKIKNWKIAAEGTLLRH